MYRMKKVLKSIKSTQEHSDTPSECGKQKGNTMKHYIGMHKESARRASIIEEAMKESVQYQLRYATTNEEKLELISNKNPLLHVFGHALTQPAYEETYTDWVEKQYPDTEPQHITTKEEAMQYLADLIQAEVHE